MHKESVQYQEPRRAPPLPNAPPAAIHRKQSADPPPPLYNAPVPPPPPCGPLHAFQKSASQQTGPYELESLRQPGYVQPQAEPVHQPPPVPMPQQQVSTVESSFWGDILRLGARADDFLYGKQKRIIFVGVLLILLAQVVNTFRADFIAIEMKHDFSGSGVIQRARGQLWEYVQTWGSRGPVILLVCNVDPGVLQEKLGSVIDQLRAMNYAVLAVAAGHRRRRA